MTGQNHMDEYKIINREKELRDWFTKGQDELMREIDGLDIGWGGSQRWVTSRMPDIAAGSHLDFACGYGTFLAEIGWRFPQANLYGLNIDYAGPHACIERLLEQAGVQVTLVQADACEMPFAEKSFGSVSCFLGLQDIKIGFGDDGVCKAVAEAMRVLKSGGYLILADGFTFDVLSSLLRKKIMKTILKDEFTLDVRWNRAVSETAIKLYSEGWAAQCRDVNERQKDAVRVETHKRMKDEMEQQLGNKGFYIPHAPVRLLVATKAS